MKALAIDSAVTKFTVAVLLPQFYPFWDFSLNFLQEVLTKSDF